MDSQTQTTSGGSGKHPKSTPTLQHSSTPSSVPRWAIGALALAAVYALIQWASFHAIVTGGPDLYWDTDPYARMYRVGSILNGHEWIVRFQNVDGFPEGHASHWTLPFDAWCVALAKLTSLHTAGLIASPLIGLLCLWSFALWCFTRLPGPVAWGATLLYLLQPSFHWATALGRPDHQSLAHGCFLLAVILDLGFWLKEFGPSRERWQPLRVILNAAALGVGMWATIETTPLWAAQVASACAIAVVMRRQGGWRALGRRALGWLLALAIIAVAFGVECRFDPTQIRIGDFTDGMMRRWFGVVHEFQPLMMTRGQWHWFGLHALFGFSFYLTPVLVWFFVRSRAVNRPFKISLCAMLAAYTIMVFAQIHWTSNMTVLWPIFAAVAIHSAVESRFRAPTLSRSYAYAAILVILFFPCTVGFLDFPNRDELGSHLQPVCEWLRKNTPSNNDTETFSMRTPQDEGYSIMTQWWQGSYVLYGARRPVVATPYHTNIDAIADSYRFFVASSWAEAEPILHARRCRYVLVEDRRMFVDDAQRVLNDGRVWIEFTQRKAPDGKMRRAFKFTPLFYETMFYRLHVLNGGGLPFQLVFESKERSEYDPGQARFKVFECLESR